MLLYHAGQGEREATSPRLYLETQATLSWYPCDPGNASYRELLSATFPQKDKDVGLR